MNRRPHRLFAALALSLSAAPLLAQQPATPEACVSIDHDADRLACYDAALGRGARDTRRADIAAKEARAIRENLQIAEQVAPAAVTPATDGGELYPHEDPLATAIANAGRGSLLDSRWELARDSKLGVFNFRAYKPVYLFPAFWSSRVNQTPHSPNPRNTVTEPLEVDALESKFQLSFKTKAAENLFGDNGDLWLAYTQSSRWQVYTPETSRPFRETNYEPEAMLVFRNNYGLGGWRGRLAGIGINHQSNGRADPLSRSWNRVIGMVGLDRENWALMLRPWWRISDGNDDDNPDIEDYVGRGDATLVYRRDGHEFALMARHSLRGGDRSHGAVQFDWGFPIRSNLRGHLQIFDGYGESLIDYNHRATYIGLGISLLEWY
ncbi:phospholipase A [Vulcaniibacterium tengchongense]|uniref:Phospholipase A1 n=1 Tax=Vulcaniibacterium tengchongense TaxID=1273429 RepID=A0A3N4VGE7_9GAMM|nr:phospholipase A [Vulcaniibacterium tengchongense]RPE81798.1 phospholipase A1 [Vulcaniibacterium tengchongense]